jgi:2-iminobutanoate/2-iminopropanoate deaminase
MKFGHLDCNRMGKKAGIIRKVNFILWTQYEVDMPFIKHNPQQLFPQYQNYSHAIEISRDARLLIISGLNGYPADGQTMPDSFDEQGDIIWRHIGTLLASANMTYLNLVSVRTYLASPEYDEPNMALRKKYLGDHEPTLTVVCAQLLLPNWKLEVEAIAAD